MKNFIIWLVSVFLILTNFEWFLGLIFDMYDSLIYVFSNMDTDYQVLAIAALFIYAIVITSRLGE